MTVTVQDRQHRAERALELLEDSVIADALRQIEEEAYLRMLKLPASDHDGRWAATVEIKAVRALKARLTTIVSQGKQSAREPIALS